MWTSGGRCRLKREFRSHELLGYRKAQEGVEWLRGEGVSGEEQRVLDRGLGLSNIHLRVREEWVVLTGG